VKIACVQHVNKSSHKPVDSLECGDLSRFGLLDLDASRVKR